MRKIWQWLFGSRGAEVAASASGRRAVVRSGAAVATVVQRSGTAMFWFDSQKMSESGHGQYGRYAYQSLLPLFSPTGRAETRSELYWFFDGDCHPENAAPHKADTACLRRLQQTRFAYVILVTGQGCIDYLAADRCLRDAGIVGYIGMSTRDGVEALNPTALSVIMSRMGLTPSLTMKLGRLRKDNFRFLSDEELCSMGFRIQ